MKEIKLEYAIEGGDFISAGRASSSLKKVLNQLNLDPSVVRRIAVSTYEAEHRSGILIDLLHQQAEKYFIDKEQGRIQNNKTNIRYKDYVMANALLGSIEPRSIMMLDENMVQAMKKMEKIKRIAGYLPGIDCGACGAPACRALSEDVVQRRARTTDCVFVAIQVKGGEGMNQVVDHTEEIRMSLDTVGPFSNALLNYIVDFTRDSLKKDRILELDNK